MGSEKSFALCFSVAAAAASVVAAAVVAAVAAAVAAAEEKNDDDYDPEAAAVVVSAEHSLVPFSVREMIPADRCTEAVGAFSPVRRRPFGPPSALSYARRTAAVTAPR